MERCLIIPRFFLALMAFSLRCFLKDKLESRIRPKYFWSLIFATIVPLNITCGWFGLDVLQNNIICGWFGLDVLQNNIICGWFGLDVLQRTSYVDGLD